MEQSEHRVQHSIGIWLVLGFACAAMCLFLAYIVVAIVKLTSGSISLTTSSVTIPLAISIAGTLLFGGWVAFFVRRSFLLRSVRLHPNGVVQLVLWNKAQVTCVVPKDVAAVCIQRQSCSVTLRAHERRVVVVSSDITEGE